MSFKIWFPPKLLDVRRPRYRNSKTLNFRFSAWSLMNQFPRVFEKKMNNVDNKTPFTWAKKNGSAPQMFGTEFTIFGQGTAQFHDPNDNVFLV